MFESMPGIYAIVVGRFIKIGYSKNVKQRMGSYRTAYPPGTAIVLGVRYYEMDMDAYSTEKGLHFELNDYRIDNREWFEYCVEVVEELLATDMEILNISI